MLGVGQNLGPFTIEKELGTGAMGAVFLGRYTKTGQRMAIKVMAAGLASTSETAAARFEREAAILKQFNHPNIVKFYGIGKSQGMRYYAMEYIQGESLDKVLARRGRMTWEELVEVGKQLCSALQHAHEQGIIHRDLKPSNLMLLRDGTLKLTDFGIAKDLDVTQLTSANCTVGTAAYMSPEQCRGERDLTHKSDLYSLGVLLYELLVGRKPFEAENVMDMFMQHVQGTFERPSRRVPETPIWLDSLICQLLEKKPEHRPLDAATVYNVLSSIREKIEAQQSAGVEAAKSRMIDRKRGDPLPDAADKEVVRELLGGKGKVKKKRKKRVEKRMVLLQAAGLFGLLLAILFTVYLVFRPPSPEKLFEEARRTWKKGTPEARAEARRGPIQDYLRYYGKRDDERTEQVRSWADQVDVAECEETVQNFLKQNKKGFNFGVNSDEEKLAFKAALAEEGGDLPEAAKGWQELDEAAGPRAWRLLAEKHLAQLNRIDAHKKDLADLFEELRRRRQEPAVEGIRLEAFGAYRYERFGDLAQALTLYKKLRDKAAKEPDLRSWFLLAGNKVRELEPRALGTDDAKSRLELVEKSLQEARRLKEKLDWMASRALCHEIIALYGDDKELTGCVKEATALLKSMDLR